MPDPLGRLKAALADRYAIEREIGAGGMATVYLAYLSQFFTLIFLQKMPGSFNRNMILIYSARYLLLKHSIEASHDWVSVAESS